MFLIQHSSPSHLAINASKDVDGSISCPASQVTCAAQQASADPARALQLAIDMHVDIGTSCTSDQAGAKKETEQGCQQHFQRTANSPQSAGKSSGTIVWALI